MADQQQQQEQHEQQQEHQVPRFICPYNFGLTLDDGSSVPLQGVSVDITILDFLAEVRLEQRFKNPSEAKGAIEAVYRFPLDAEAVLKSFSVELDDGTVVTGQVQERQRAADTYDDALAGGHAGFLLQEDNEMKDVFSLRVGNLAPGAAATVRLTYVAQVDEEAPEDPGGNSSLRFVLPTAVAPRYAPRSDQPPELYQHAEAVLAKWPKDLLKVTGRITAATPILGLTPHTFKEEASLEVDGGSSAAFGLTAAHLDEDFVLTVHLQGQLPDRCWVDRATGAATVAAGLRPGQLAAAGVGAAADDEEDEAEGEFIFVIDRSGSMAGGSILQAREALALCVSALPLGARFQIVGFGNDFTQLFPEGPTPFDDNAKATALAHCGGLDADMGGTEILPPLKAIAAVAATKGPRQVFVITDGQVCNTAGVLAFVRDDHRRHGTRYFALGIGAGASRALVKGVAEHGGGSSAFVVEGERLQRKVMAQMNRALEPGLADARVVVNASLRLLAEGGGGFAPKKPRPLFTGARLLYYGSVDPAGLAGVVEGAEGLVAVVGTAGAGAKRKEVSLPVPLRFVGGEAEGRMLQALATRAALRDLEEEEEEAAASAAAEGEGEATQKAKAAAVKARAVALSEKSGVLCKWTSYVAVAERKDPVTGALKPVHLPLAFVNKANSGDPWSYMQRSNTGMFACAGAAAPMTFAACSPPPPPPGMAMGGMAGRMAMPMMAMAAPMAPAPQQRHPLAKRGGLMHRMLGRTAKVMDTTAEADDAAAAAMAANNAFPVAAAAAAAPRFLGPPVHAPADANNAAAGPMDHVAIVARQRAGGDWEWDAAFLSEALGVDAAKLEQAVDTQLAQLGAWATALLLARLEQGFAAFAEEWEAAARKARRWLGKQLGAAAGGGAGGVDVAGLVKRAGEALEAAA